MVRAQLEERGIRDVRVLAAMSAVPRHEFVPESVRQDAYEDHPLPIGEGQTISQPYIVAAMLEHLALRPTDRVLEGAPVRSTDGSCRCYRPKCFRWSAMPRWRPRGDAGPARLWQREDQSRRWQPRLERHAPFDAILSRPRRAMCPARSRPTWGRGAVIIPVGSPVMQELLLITKRDGRREARVLEGCRFVPLVEGDVHR